MYPAVTYTPMHREYDIAMLEHRLAKLKPLELWAIRNGVITLMNGQVWKIK